MANEPAAIDASFLVHALVPAQRTAEAVAAMEHLLFSRAEILASPALGLEFASLLRKMRNRGVITSEEMHELFDQLVSLPAEPVLLSETLLRDAWSIADDLGQSDVFDSVGYALAIARGGEFWTSDQRFANAAANRGLSGVVFVP